MNQPPKVPKVPLHLVFYVPPKKKEDIEALFLEDDVAFDLSVIRRPGTEREIIAAGLSLKENQNTGHLASCIMVTRGNRTKLTARAIECFKKQSYDNRELVIVTDDGPLPFIEDIIKYVGKEVHQIKAPPGLTLGELRNVGIAHSSGHYIAQWDDDDWYHPDRLTRQIGVLEQSPDSDGCTLERWTLAWPERNLYALSSRHPWEGSIVARRWRIPCYPALKKREDTPVIQNMKLVSLDEPDLYLYVIHGENTWDAEHFECIFKDATETLREDAIIEIKRRLDTQPSVPLFSSVNPLATSFLTRNLPTPTPSPKKKRFAFVLHPFFTVRPFSPARLLSDPRGLTGSDKACFMLAREISRAGHDVAIYSNFLEAGEFENCLCIPYEALEQGDGKRQWDGAVAFNHPATLCFFAKDTRKIFNQQVNDFGYCQAWEQYVDIATSPSRTHRDFLKTQTTFQHWEILPNGCYPDDYPVESEKISGRIIHASSPDRGLHHVLDMFPRLQKLARDAGMTPPTLDIYYELSSLRERTRQAEGIIPLRICQIGDALDRRHPDITSHGSVSCDQMKLAMSSGHMMLYPCDTLSFTEGFSVTTLEAAAAGCLPIITGTDALGEIYGDYLPVLRPPYIEHHREFLLVAAHFLKDKVAYTKAQARAREIAHLYDWRKIARQLLDLLVR